MLNKRFILHSDLNNFYASVECKENPKLREKAVIVVGDASLRHGIVLAKNSLAKSFGIKTGDTIWEAQLKSGKTELITIKADLKKYMKYSKMVRAIYGEYSNYVESYGIDECWLDISILVKNFKQAEEVANLIREEVFKKTGLTVSIGVSFNKIFAKLGSDIKKPNAVTVITNENYKDIVWKLPVEELLYIGKATYSKLKKCNINTIGDLAIASIEFLKKLLGKMGEYLWNFANGLDESRVRKINEKDEIKSIGNSTTTPVDITNLKQVETVFYVLAECIAFRMKLNNLWASAIQISIKDNSLNCFERQSKLNPITNLSDDIAKRAIELFNENYDFSKPIRALGLRTKDFSENPMQENIFLQDLKHIKMAKMENAVQLLRKKFGNNVIKRGVVMQNSILSTINPLDELHQIHPEIYKMEVDEEFWIEYF